MSAEVLCLRSFTMTMFSYAVVTHQVVQRRCQLAVPIALLALGPECAAIAQSPALFFQSRSGQLSGNTRHSSIGCPSGTPVQADISNTPTTSAGIHEPPLSIEFSGVFGPLSCSSHATVAGYVPPGWCNGPLGTVRDDLRLNLTVPSIVDFTVVRNVTPATYATNPSMQGYSSLRVSGNVPVLSNGGRLQLAAGAYSIETIASNGLFSPANWSISCDSFFTVVAPCTTVAEQPLSQATCMGADVELRFGVVGPGPWTFVWSRDGQPFATTTGQTAYPFGTLLASSLFLRGMDQTKTGSYTCAATTPTGLCTNVTSAPASVSIVPACDGACCDVSGSICTLPGPTGCRSWETFKPGQTCTPSPCVLVSVNCCTSNGCTTNPVDPHDCDLAGLSGVCVPATCDEAKGVCCAASGACYPLLIFRECEPGDTPILGPACQPLNPCREREPGEPRVWGSTVTITGTFWRGGACCMGTTCAVAISAYACQVAGGHLFPGATACNTVGVNTVPCCKANFNHADGSDVQDIFDFLAAWFLQDPTTNINGVDGTNVQDIFDFLAAWFVGC